MRTDLDGIERRLREAALAFPEAVEEFPWGESAFKVRGKVFMFFRHGGEELSLSFKLPVSRDFASVFDFTQPTGYGLGKSGWITCRLAPDTDADIELIERWIEESWRAVAPKRLVKALAPSGADAPF